MDQAGLSKIFGKISCLTLAVLLFGCGGSGGSSAPSSVATTAQTEPAEEPPSCPSVSDSISYNGRDYPLQLHMEITEAAACTGLYVASDTTFDSAFIEQLRTILNNIDRELTIDHSQILIDANTDWIDGLTGLGGQALGEKRIVLSIDTEIATQDQLHFFMARQSHRNRRAEMTDFDHSLQQAVVSEGMALAFAKQQQPLVDTSIETSVIAPLDYDTYRSDYELAAASDNFEHWFNGSMSIVENAGYQLGYEINQRFLSHHPASSPALSSGLNAEYFSAFSADIDPANPVLTLKTDLLVRTPDINEFDQVPIADIRAMGLQHWGDYIVEGFSHRKIAALTFDDGPSSYTQQVLDILKTKHVTANFFLTGASLRSFTDFAQQAARDGHMLGNHTLNHNHNAGLSPTELWDTVIQPTNDLFAEYLGFEPRLFRPSYGEISSGQVDYLVQRGMKSILWSIDTRDWNTASVSVGDIIDACNDNIHPEAIILMHDAGGNRQNTVDALSDIIDFYHDQGYRFVRLDELLGVSEAH